MNQTRVLNNVTSSSVSDFEIDGKVFEIGERKKGQKQIESVQEGYIVKDDIENGLRQHRPTMGIRTELLAFSPLVYHFHIRYPPPLSFGGSG